MIPPRSIVIIGLTLAISGCSAQPDESPSTPTSTTKPATTPSVTTAPPTDVLIPDIKGMSGEAARKVLIGMGLVGSFAPPVVNMPDLYDRGHWVVTSQTPAAGAEAQPGDEVKFVAAQVGPLASEVIAAFKEKGLPVTEPRDNTEQNCYGVVHECVMLMTTEDVSVYEFANERDATAFLKSWGAANAHQEGVIVLSYLAARTPDKLRPRYEAALTTLMGDY
ncbi:hypothetical protein GCM10023153_24730 [Ornithinibacter aureus]|uniref:PASTA domain-containing protein n=1 Tax=Ornithinibacter aureus TaxID=622664 RepID=A0ABP8K1B4_9MICO|nr:PASTA domain-containing protein [Ornithinibacter aureus]KAF0833083.1 PASTA domain-containing protein [Ornithinibacter aureus]